MENVQKKQNVYASINLWIIRVHITYHENATNNANKEDQETIQ